MKVLLPFLPRSVLVTGANRGLGLEFVKYFVKKNQLPGAQPTTVISCARKMSPELEELLEDIHHIDVDVTNEVQVNDAASKVSKIVGSDGLSLLINNAAIMRHGKGVSGCSVEEMKETLDTNLIGVHAMTRSFQPLLKQSAESQADLPVSCSRAAICNLSAELGSIKGTNKNFLYTAYKVSKAGLNMYTKCSAVDLIKDNIICFSVHPGWAQTGLGGPQAPLSGEAAVEDMIEIMSNCTKKQNGAFLRKGMNSIMF